MQPGHEWSECAIELVGLAFVVLWSFGRRDDDGRGAMMVGVIPLFRLRDAFVIGRVSSGSRRNSCALVRSVCTGGYTGFLDHTHI